jgi:serine/threonine protein kinase
MVGGEASEDRFGLTGSTLADRYYVEAQVGEGGFAVVYRACQVALERRVALKVLKAPPGLDDAATAHFRERFAAEAKTIATLKHPYIVSVYDFGVSRMASGELAPWMALEWLDGETLESDLDRRHGTGGRPAAEAVPLLRPVIEALAYAHRWGVVHRDIKPANMMSVATETGQVLRMLDFGIAKIMRADQVEGTKRTGTSSSPAFSPDYAAPEQVTFSRTGPWTDVHALGLVLTEILTGQTPYSQGADAQLFEQVMSPVRPTPKAKGRDVGRLEKVIAKAVALSPGQRWQNAGEFLAALNTVGLERSPAPRVKRKSAPQAVVSAPPRKVASAPSPARRARQNFGITVAGTVAVVVALALLAGTLGGSGSPPSAARELSVARVARARAASERRGRSATSPAGPWIETISIPPSPRPEAAAPARGPAASLPRSNPDLHTASLRLPPSAPAPATCQMTINSVPWSEVWIDGKNTGSHTPIVDYAVACGRHRLEFKRADLGIDDTEHLVAEPGETVKHRYTLTAAE